MTPETLIVELGERSYPIIIGNNILFQLAQSVKERTAIERVMLVSDEHVSELYADPAFRSLTGGGFSVESHVIPEGERAKTLDTCMGIYASLLANNFGRESLIVALGGGVVGDISGFVAATYMRGIPFVQVPTTLLAMVDSSVGGKTGVNHPLGKNMIGAFHQPLLVFMDLGCLATLNREEFRAGFAEVIKYGIIRDPELFDLLEREREPIFALHQKALRQIVRRSCEIKAEVVSTDERESGLRAILNFGHTVGHAIESLTNYSLLKHGEAVAIGMVAAGRLAVAMERFAEADQARLEKLLEESGLPTRIPNRLDTEDVLDRLRKDKKVQHGKVRFVLPEAIGRVFIETDPPPALLRAVLDGMRE